MVGDKASPSAHQTAQTNSSNRQIPLPALYLQGLAIRKGFSCPNRILFISLIPVNTEAGRIQNRDMTPQPLTRQHLSGSHTHAEKGQTEQFR